MAGRTVAQSGFMAGSSPWSTKGVAPEAREAAKIAARRVGARALLAAIWRLMTRTGFRTPFATGMTLRTSPSLQAPALLRRNRHYRWTGWTYFAKELVGAGLACLGVPRYGSGLCGEMVW